MAVTDNKDGWSCTSVSADFTFNLLGGRYGIAVSATWGGGSATLKTLMPDGSTYVTVLSAFSADGSAIVDLPPGSYKLVVATATALTGFLIRVPYRAA